ncbi:MAG: TlyA family RNA methyltransferase [Xanthobacteraceae bacterium]|nr:TlyA family RNA methyltransferase [Xanthobacteraceae bacterium]MCW5673921.1 TlyA family RNA methyltransferase [Xanthobacteraceae bacterium]
MKKTLRADQLLVARGLFESRAKAQAAIEAGNVLANGKVVRKVSEQIAEDAEIVASPAHPYVSRGGLKLEAALDHFGINPSGKICLDVGASTGGFTELLLARGAAKVYAVDAGTDQLHPRIKSDPRVVSLEQTDIRKLDEAAMPDDAQLIVIDVSFISLELVLPQALAFAAPHAELIALIKPQFEAGREHVKKGIVRDPEVHMAVCQRVELLVGRQGWRLRGTIASPVLGGDGNAEFLLYAEH